MEVPSLSIDIEEPQGTGSFSCLIHSLLESLGDLTITKEIIVILYQDCQPFMIKIMGDILR
jgi:hypothetical protein